MAGEKVALKTGRPLEANVRVSTEDTVVFELKLSSLEEMPVEIDGQPVNGRIAWVNVTDEGDRLIIGMALDHDEEGGDSTEEEPATRDHTTTKLMVTSRPPLPPFPPEPTSGPEEPPEPESRKEPRIPTEGIVILSPPEENSEPVMAGRRGSAGLPWRHITAFGMGLILSLGLGIGYMAYSQGLAAGTRHQGTTQTQKSGQDIASSAAGKTDAATAQEAAKDGTKPSGAQNAKRITTENNSGNSDKSTNTVNADRAAAAKATTPETRPARESDEILVTRRGRTIRMIIPLASMPEGFSHYILKAPWGVVVNVKADTRAKSLVPETPGVKRIKVLKLSTGHRFIVYTRARPKNVHIRTTSTSLTLSFTL